MQCSKCGNQIISGQNFCTKCGQPVNVVPRPVATKAPRPMTPVAPHAPKAPGQPVMPQSPRPVVPQAPSPFGPQPTAIEDKGFLSRVGHGIAAAASGRSFAQGYEQQRAREHTFEDLCKVATIRISEAAKALKQLQKLHPGIISDSDELDVADISKRIQNLLSAPSASEGAKNAAIRKALKELDEKIYSLQVKCDPSLARLSTLPNDEATLRDRNIPVVQLHDVNEDELAIVQKKAIWGIQPGQIARRITERELNSVEGLNGFIIRDGCQAMIFVNGQLVNVFDEGAYDIPQRSEKLMKEEFKKLFEEMDRQDKEKRAAARLQAENRSFLEMGGVVGWVGRGLQHISEFIFGANPASQKNVKSEAERVKDLEEKINKALQAKNRETVLSIVLVRKGLINMTFGGVYDGDKVQYQPYNIPTKLFDVQIGVSLQLKVNEIHQMANNYLADRNSFTTNDLFQVLNQSIEGEIVEILRNTDYEQEGLSDLTRNLLKQRIQNLINKRLLGIVCDNIERITDRNEDFERFRQIERELYCSEKDLDYMQRTGEIRNRMEQEQNRQLLSSAQNKEDLAYAMQQIDKEHLLHQDEWDDFVRMLESQRIIKQATSQEEIYEALQDLQKNHLVKDDEYAALVDSLEHNRINRNEITEIMRIQANENISMADFKARFAIGDFNQDHEWEREDLARRRNWGIEDEEREREWMRDEREYDRQRGRLKAEEDYNFEVMMRQRALNLEDHDRERRERLEDEDRQRSYARQDKFDDDQLEENAHKRQLESLEAAMRLQMQQDLQEQRHAENLASISANEQMNRDNNFANMSAEQIRAVQLSHLTGEAQVAMANAYSSDKINEVLQQQAAKEETRRLSDMDRMERMFNQMGQNMMGMSQNMMNAQQQRVDELRQDALHQQERLDRTTLAAMSVSSAAASNLGAFNGGASVSQQSSQPQSATVVTSTQPQMIECQCYNCQKTITIPEGAVCCPECGAPFQW